MKKRNYIIFVSLTAGLVLTQLSGCSSSKVKETSAQETTVAPTEAETASIPNPIEEVGNEQDFEAMGVHMVAPADGENKQFFIINGEVAEISFSENGVSYCYRASNTAEDFAGIFERFKDDILVVSWKSGDAAGEAQVKTTESGGRLASWSWGSTFPSTPSCQSESPSSMLSYPCSRMAVRFVEISL